MTTRIPRVLAVAASLACGATATLAAGVPLVRIDTEQKATAAFITAYHSTESTYHHDVTIPGSILLGLRALQTASQATTPVALTTLPAGVEVPCATSGSMVARMAPQMPRVFRFEWRQCRYPQDGYDQTLDGTGEMVLLSDSFTPDKVASLRLGSQGRDLVQTQILSFPSFSVRNDNLRNILLVGNIPMKDLRSLVPNSFTPFTYLVNGFVDLQQTSQFGSDPASVNGQRETFDAVTYTGTATSNADGTRSDTDRTTLFGKLTYTRREPPPYGTWNEIYRFLGYRVHDTFDWAGLESSQTIDGGLDLTWGPFGAGCLSGAYDFRTKSPIRRQMTGSQSYTGGEIAINGERVSLYTAANVPPTLPVPINGLLVHIEAPGVGTFNYDVNDLLNGLRPVSRCL